MSDASPIIRIWQTYVLKQSSLLVWKIVREWQQRANLRLGLFTRGKFLKTCDNFLACLEHGPNEHQYIARMGARFSLLSLYICVPMH
jgi:hypothetical protein